LSLIPLTASLIRRAATDETYAQDLYDVVASNPIAFDGLVSAPVERVDLGWLSASEWHWFACWREGMGASLDELLIDYLAFMAASRAARFELRGLVMRHPATMERAPGARASDRQLEDTGLRWLQRHALLVPDRLELARDALQYATPAAWFTLRVLTSFDDQRSEDVRRELQAFAEERELSPELTREWTRRD